METKNFKYKELYEIWEAMDLLESQKDYFDDKILLQIHEDLHNLALDILNLADMKKTF